MLTISKKIFFITLRNGYPDDEQVERTLKLNEYLKLEMAKN